MLQADHYVIRAFQPEPRGVEELIRAVLDANGHKRGNASVDYGVSSSIDEAYMTALGLKHEQETGNQWNWSRSRLHSFSGTAPGKLMAFLVLSE